MVNIEKKTRVIQLETMGVKQKDISKITNLSISSVSYILNDSKRIIVISDAHCGHRSGLTPPAYQREDHQVEIWNWYSATVRRLKGDILFCLGDMIDGKGRRSGGTELVTSDRLIQCDMAIEVVEEANCKTKMMVYGTPYHTGDEEDYESIIARNVNAVIKSHLFPVCNGIQFDLKHKVGGSTIPHGRATALAKSKLWNKMWVDHDKGQPRADILIRGHVHYHEYTGNPQGLAMTCPALQGWGSKFGERQCEGIVDTGLLWFDIRPGDTLETLKWYPSLPKFKYHSVKSYEV